ncbi:MAG: hypothetical protein GC154_02945 [bacterium]|nr:hypothetical protein [bacterium]
MSRKSETQLLLALIVGLLAVILFKTAWLCDDAFITYRTVDNLFHGYGLRWNVDERVQAYTHPLWMFVIAFGRLITGETYYAAILTSIGLTLFAVLYAAFRLTASEGAALLVLAMCILSKAFIDYGTSGLENPLSYALMALFWGLYLSGEPTPRTLFRLSLLASLITLNRMDEILIVAPALAHTFYRNRSWKHAGLAALGFTPFIAWEAFSVVYYGFPFPNTAYAKLGSGLPQAWLLEHGFQYLMNSLRRDPVTLTVIAGFIALACMTRDTRRGALAAGTVLYLAYIVKAGGDFMSGRMLSVPFFCAALAWGREQADPRAWRLWAALAVLIALGFAAPNPSFLSGVEYGININKPIDDYGIADERAEYYQRTGLMKVPVGEKFSSEWMVKFVRETRAHEGDIIKQGNMGLMGFYGGPEIHFVDVFALTDPLLARLPARRDFHQRIGHFWRMVPEGYIETIRSGELKFRDPNLAKYYEKLRLITSGPLFSAARWAAIVKMNLGLYSHWIDREYYQSEPWSTITLDDLSRRLPNEIDWDHEDTFVFFEDGLTINLGGVHHEPWIEISLDSNDLYTMQYRRGGDTLLETPVPENPAVKRGMASRVFAVPPEVSEGGYDQIRILPKEGDDAFSIGHLFLYDDKPEGDAP